MTIVFDLSAAALLTTPPVRHAGDIVIIMSELDPAGVETGKEATEALRAGEGPNLTDSG